MTDRDKAILAILDEDQGVCPDGHDCRLWWFPHAVRRTCSPVGLYVGWPLIRLDATPEQIEAVELIDPDLAEWARSTLADQETNQSGSSGEPPID